MSDNDEGGGDLERSVLSSDQYAHVLAHLSHFKERSSSEVLDRLGVTATQWAAAKSHWLAELRAEFDDDESPLARRIGASFAEVKAELESGRPPLEEVPLLLEPPKVGAEFESVDETTFGVAAISADPLPFAPSEATRQPPPLAPEPPSDAVGMTQLAVRALEVPKQALPFAGEEEIPALTLTQYASLHAELAHTPERKDAILPRYGIANDKVRTKLDAAWSERFVADLSQQRTFAELVAAYVGWLNEPVKEG